MVWTDRLKKPLYTSFEGNTFTFLWESAEESFGHRASIFRFPKVDGANVLSLGTGESRYPLDLIINGPDYDLEAARVIEILKEKGNGVLEHPIYGRKTVQPTEIRRSDNPISDGGQAVISVLFIESTALTFPGTSEDTKKRLEDLQENFDVETSDEYDVQQRANTAQDNANTQTRFDTYVKSVSDFLAPIAEFNDTVNAQFKAIELSINNNLTALVGKPLVLASQTIALIKTPGRITQSLGLRINGYKDLATQLRERATISAISNDSRNSLLESRFILSTTTAALAQTLLVQDFNTKSEALTAANELRELHALNRDFIETEESKFQGSPLELLLYGDSQESKNLSEIVQITAARLADLSFDLKLERVFTTASPRNILDLTNELYGNIDIANIDLLISSNNLQGDEIILVPRQRQILYYV